MSKFVDLMVKIAKLNLENMEIIDGGQLNEVAMKQIFDNSIKINEHLTAISKLKKEN